MNLDRISIEYHFEYCCPVFIGSDNGMVANSRRTLISNTLSELAVFFKSYNLIHWGSVLNWRAIFV